MIPTYKFGWTDSEDEFLAYCRDQVAKGELTKLSALELGWLLNRSEFLPGVQGPPGLQGPPGVQGEPGKSLPPDIFEDFEIRRLRAEFEARESRLGMWFLIVPIGIAIVIVAAILRFG
jgi:hypothetical protein